MRASIGLGWRDADEERRSDFIREEAGVGN